MTETQRVAMIWPSDLKDAAREQLGQRSLTEFVIEAVKAYMEIDGDLNSLRGERDEARALGQRLADQLVIAGDSPEQRVQALAQTQFPSWIDTTGWPKAFVEQVRPAPFEPPKVGEKVQVQMAKPAKPVSEPAPSQEPREVEYEVVLTKTETSAVPEEPKPSEPWTPGAGRKGGDLFERVMARTGGALADVPGLTVASQIDPPVTREPEPVVEEESSGLYVDDDDQAAEALAAGKCPKCGEDLIDGECWTCG